jgi:hypothetical protein
MLDNYNDDIYFKRYLKYKSKYLELKQSGGGLFSYGPYTVKMQKEIYNKFHDDGIKNSDDYTQNTEYKDITKKLIPNFINDNKSSLKQEITTALNMKYFIKISLDNSSLEKVDITTNLAIIDILMMDTKNFNDIFINQLKFFLSEIGKYIDDELRKIQDIKYTFELKNIFEMYISFLIAFINKHLSKNYEQTVRDNGKGDNRYTKPGAVRNGPNAFFPT